VIEHSKDYQRPWKDQYGKGTQANIGNIGHANLPDLFNQTSLKWGKKKAFTAVLPNGFSGSLSFAQTDALSDDFAVYLHHVLKIQKGDKVAIQLPNCLAYPIAAFGVLKAGGVIVNTNPLYTPHEMRHQFQDSGVRAVIILDMFMDKLDAILTSTSVEKIIVANVADFFPLITKKVTQFALKYIQKQIPASDSYHTLFTEALQTGHTLKIAKAVDAKRYWSKIQPSDIAVLQYTGGTTGVSKGAMLTHANLLANIQQITEIGKSQISYGNETLLTVLPLYHIFAFTLNLLTFYSAGAHNILIPNPRPITNIKKALQTYPITWIAGVNTLFNALNQERWFTQNPPQFLKMSIAGGASLHEAVAEEWFRITKTPVIEGYGLTEAGPVVSFNPIGGQVKRNTVGIPVPSTDVILLDDQGYPVPMGTAGEIAVRGPQVMHGYWGRPDETTRVFQGEWLLTGDVGVFDEQGYLRIVDRKKDVILVSGFNVYPNEIEDCISKCQGVAEVAVIGVPHSVTGESVKAFIVKKDPRVTIEEITEHCRTYLTSYKIPRYIEFKPFLPKSNIGKILRKNLRVDTYEAVENNELKKSA
jgi:long-chain acyl-CoA synthetase